MAACERCPFAGGCGSRPLCRPQTVEFGKKILVVSNIKPLLEKQELPDVVLRFSPDPSRQGISELPTPRRTSKETETCSECQKEASTCSHSTKTSALKAA